MKKKSRVVIKLVSIVISINLLLVNTCYGITVNTTPGQYIESKLYLLDVHLPESVGCVENVWQTDSNSGYKVILIKDAHCNYEAQKNIARIVETLIRDYKVNLVCIEGASGKVDTSVFQSFPYRDMREKAVEKYMGKGLLSGTEALSISKALDLPFTIWGVEDSKLYVEDFKAFRNTMVYGGEASFFITNLKKIINLLKSHVFSQGLFQFDNKLNEYLENRLSLSDWAKYLRNQKPVRPTPRVGAPNQKNFNLVVKSLELEEKIDFKAVENERVLLIKELEKILVKEELEGLIKQSLYFKLGKISGIKYYTYLETLIPNGSSAYPNLLKYINLVKLQSRIDSDGLFSELEVITNKSAEGYFCGGLDRQLYELSYDCRILDKLFRLNVSRSELDYYHKNRDKFQIDKLLSIINIQAPLYNISLPIEFKDEGFLKKVRELMAPAEEFYRLALKRDDVLVMNLLAKMEKDNKQTAIIVTGGFHSQGIEERLKDKGIAYITISPKITKIQDNNPYLGLMLDSDLDISSIFLKEPSNISLPPLSVQSRHCAELGRYLFGLKKSASISEIRKAVPSELKDAFNELVRLAEVQETQSVDDLLRAISPDNIISEIASKDFPNETLAEAEVERLKLALLVAGINDSTPYLERLRKACPSIDRMLTQKGAGFIGKYEVLKEPMFDKASGEVSAKVRDIETGQERNLRLDARLERTKVLRKLFNRLKGMTKDSLARSIIEESSKLIPDEFLIIEEDSMNNKQAGIFGIGRVRAGEKYTIAIAESLLDDPVALFHEIGEMYFSERNISGLEGLSEKRLFAHTFLRGCGKKLRGYLKQWGDELNDIESYGRFKEFCRKEYGYVTSEREERLILFNIKEKRKGEEALWGLQDKAFGPEANLGLTKRIGIGGSLGLEDTIYYQMQKGEEVNNKNILDLLRNLSRTQGHCEPIHGEITCVVYRTKETVHASTNRGSINEFSRRSEHIGTPVVIPNVYIADGNNPDKFVKLTSGQIAERFGLEVVMDGSKPLTVRVRTHNDHGRMFYVDQDMTVVLTKNGSIKGKYFGVLSESEIPDVQEGDRVLYGAALEFKGLGTPRCRGTYSRYSLSSKVKSIGAMLSRHKFKLKKGIKAVIEETIATAQNEGELPKVEWPTFYIDKYFKQKFSIRYIGKTYEECKARHIERKPEHMDIEATTDYLNELRDLGNYEVIQWLTPDWIKDAGAGMFFGFRYQEIVPDAPGTVKYHSEERARRIEKEFLRNGGIPTVVSIAEVPLDVRENISEGDKGNYGSSDHGFSIRVRTGGIRRMNNADQTMDLIGDLSEKVFMDVRHTLDNLLYNVARNVRAYLLTDVRFSNDELRVGKDIDVTGGQCDHGEMEYIGGKNKKQCQTALIEKFCGFVTQIFINISGVYKLDDWMQGFSKEEISAENRLIYMKFLLSLFDGNIESVNNIMRELSNAERRGYSPAEMDKVLAKEIYRYWQDAWPDTAEGKLVLAETLLAQRLDGFGKVLAVKPSGRLGYEEYGETKGAVIIDRFRYDALLDKRIGDLIDEADKSGYQDKVRLNSIRFAQAMLYAKSGDVSKAKYICSQTKRDGQDAEDLEKAIEDYQRFLYAWEAVTAGSIDGAERNLGQISQEDLRKRIEALMQKLPQKMPRGSKASWELRRLLRLNPKASGVFESPEFPNLVFKAVSEHERYRYEEEMESMWRIAQERGYELAVIDGYILIKIDGIAPFAYMNGIIIQQKTKSLDEQYPDIDLAKRRKITDKIAKALKRHLEGIVQQSRFCYSMVKKYQQLHFSGVTRVPDICEEDIGFIEGKHVYIGIGKTSADGASTRHNLVKLLDAETVPKELAISSAYFGEGSQEVINPQIKRIFEDETGEDFYCMFGTTDEGRRGNLNEAEQYRGVIEKAIRGLGIEGYDVVVLRGMNFSGHYGVSRKRIYVPIEILEVAKENPDIGQDLVNDFIKHEYLESTGLSHEETMARCDAELNKRAQILYREYVAKRILEGIEDAEGLKRRISRILKGSGGIKDPKELLLSLEKGKRFELTPKIARLVDLMSGDSYAGKRGKKVLLIVKAILDEFLKDKDEEYKFEEVEEKLLRTMKKIAQEKGIDSNCFQSVFDLFRQGMDLLTLYPELNEGEVDGAYFELVDLLGQITGLQPGTIMNIFTKEFGIKARVTQGADVPDSILDREVRRLRVYLDLQGRKDYRFTEEDKRLFNLDFSGAAIVQNPVQYLSETDAVSKDVKNLCQGLSKGARDVLENSQPTMLYYHASSFIDLDKVEVKESTGGRQRITFSHEPGLMAVLGKGLVRIALGVSKDKKGILEKIIESSGLKNKVFVVDEVTSAEEMKGVMQGFKDINRNNFVFVNNGRITEDEAKNAAQNGIKVFGLESGSSFHASLLFGVMFARTQSRGEIRDVINSLGLFGVSREEVDRILEQLEKGLLYFTVKFVRIKDTLENFRNHRLYTDVAA